VGKDPGICAIAHPVFRIFDLGKSSEREPKRPEISYTPRPTIMKGLSRWTADILKHMLNSHLHYDSSEIGKEKTLSLLDQRFKWSGPPLNMEWYQWPG
jgi:hypothetical protein